MKSWAYAFVPFAILVLLFGAYLGLTFQHQNPKPGPLAEPLVANNLNDIFGNLSHVAFRMSFTVPSQSPSFVGSYNFTGSVIERSNSSHILVVNLTQWSFNQNQGNRSTAILYVAQNGTAFQATIDGVNTSSGEAQSISFIFVSAFNLGSDAFGAFLRNSTLLSSLNYTGTTSLALGNLTLQAQNYQGTNVTLGHEQITSLKIQAGNLTQSFSIPSLVSEQRIINGGLTSFSFELEAATRA
jgi:hypothetical protein